MYEFVNLFITQYFLFSLMVKNEGDSNTSAAQKEILEREDVYMENYRGPFTR